MEKRKIIGNTLRDMHRFGWVVMEFKLVAGAWIGYDAEGNKWMAAPELFRLMDWARCQCEEQWYRCAKPEALRAAGASCLPLRNVHDARN